MSHSRTPKTVTGRHAPPPRVTAFGALVFGLAAALPIGAILWIAEWALRQG